MTGSGRVNSRGTEGSATATWGQAKAAAMAFPPRVELMGHVAPLPHDPRAGHHGDQEPVKMSGATSCSDPQDPSFLGFPAPTPSRLLLTYGALGSRTP